MGISIRDPEVGELARELANLRKTNMTEAIAHALRSELKRERDKRPLGERLAELAARDASAMASARRPRRSHEGRNRATMGSVRSSSTRRLRGDPIRRADWRFRTSSASDRGAPNRRLTSPVVRLETCMVLGSRLDTFAA